MIAHMIKVVLDRFRKYLINPDMLDKQIVMQGTVLAKMNRSQHKLSSLSDTEWSGFSQWGEDGIIDWLVENITDIPKTFIEFGVENYQESNTRMLLHLRNWRGLVMDGSTKHIQNIKRQNIYWRYDLTAKEAFIDRDNINALISQEGISGDIGLLSIDIDGNDYWIWEALHIVKPVIVICEYNAILGDLRQLSVPYQANFRRTHAHHSNLYFGASLPALIHLGSEKGYTFMGSTSTGLNAFFLRNDFAKKIFAAIDKIVAFPSVLRESRDKAGNLTFARAMERVKLIQELPLFDFESQSMTTLAECDDIYSSAWKPVL